MAEPDLSGPDEVRRDAKRALRDDSLASIREALKFVGGLGALCGLVGGGVAAIRQFNAVWLIALVTITVAGGFLAFAVVEISRLRRHSTLLSELVASERYYDNLLRSAKDDLREAEDAARTLQARLDMVLGLRELTGGAAPRRPEGSRDPEES